MHTRLFLLLTPDFWGVPALIIGLLLAAGIARAFHEAIDHSPACLAHWGAWWDFTDSWKLKYRDKDPAKGAAFFGSTTGFVFLTDAWHYTNFLTWALTDAAFLSAAVPTLGWWALLAVVGRRVVFEPFYHAIRA